MLRLIVGFGNREERGPAHQEPDRDLANGRLVRDGDFALARGHRLRAG
jgi:hypothetical protein